MISPLRQAEKLERAQGCLLGQLAGDALGSLVEFETPEQIRREFPNGVRELADGGTWSTIAGQPTDDSEMALLLARMLADQGRYDPEEARKAYLFWLDSDPFDCGTTISKSLRGRPNPDSQANGAMMRISPLGIFGANHDSQHVPSGRDRMPRSLIPIRFASKPTHCSRWRLPMPSAKGVTPAVCTGRSWPGRKAWRWMGAYWRRSEVQPKLRPPTMSTSRGGS